MGLRILISRASKGMLETLGHRIQRFTSRQIQLPLRTALPTLLAGAEDLDCARSQACNLVEKSQFWPPRLLKALIEDIG